MGAGASSGVAADGLSAVAAGRLSDASSAVAADGLSAVAAGRLSDAPGDASGAMAADGIDGGGGRAVSVRVAAEPR